LLIPYRPVLFFVSNLPVTSVIFTLSLHDALPIYVIVDNLDVHIPTGKITSIIGPNGCGKSTLLKALSRLLPIKDGEIKLDGENLHTQSTKEVAKKIAILPQSPEVADGLTVGEL